MPSYRIGSEVVRSEDPRLEGLLADLYSKKKRPLCACRNPGVEMYLAKIEGQILVKRMPNSGSDHSPNCDSYEPPPELSGLGQVVGTAIQEDADKGLTALRLDFAMSKTASRAAPVTTGAESDTVKTDGTKLTLRSMLHYLWDEAGFSKWSPSMQGKRSWSVIRKFLLQSTENKVTKGAALTDSLYVPETFSMEKKDAITQRRIARMMKIAAAEKGTRKLMMLIGEVKEIGPSRYGYKIVVKHLADCPFMMPEDLHKRMQKRFENELSLWNGIEGTHLMIVATFSVGNTGIPSIEECALMVVNDNWIPFENTFDHTLIDMLTRGNRRFTKGLRYNLSESRPLACAVLTDTHPEPTAMYIVPPNASDSYNETLSELTSESKLNTWTWNVGEGEMPPIPQATATV